MSRAAFVAALLASRAALVAAVLCFVSLARAAGDTGMGFIAGEINDPDRYVSLAKRAKVRVLQWLPIRPVL